jgi:hypothetical protein
MLNVTLKNVKTMFDSKTVLTPAEKAARKLYGRVGAYCRKVMANSIKPAKSSSQHAAAGAPPLSHTGPINFKRTIFYVVGKEDVVIGAVLLSNTAASKASNSPLPALLEFGGARGTLSSRAQRGRRRRPGEIAAHPYAAPALEKTNKKLPDWLDGCIAQEA